MTPRDRVDRNFAFVARLPRHAATLLVAVGALLLGSSIAVAGSGQFTESSAGGNSAAAAQYNPSAVAGDGTYEAGSGTKSGGGEGTGDDDAGTGDDAGPGTSDSLPSDGAGAGAGGIPSASAGAAGEVARSLPFTGLPLLPLGLIGLLLVLAGLAMARRDRAAAA